MLSVQWSEVGSSSWVNLEVVGPTGEGTTGGWYDISIDLDNAGLLDVEAFQFRVIAEDVGEGSVIEAGLDAISLARLTCEDDNQCEGDVDGNGEVNVNDILNVIAVFGTDDPSGDANGDGQVDISDILLVISHWGEC